MKEISFYYILVLMILSIVQCTSGKYYLFIYLKVTRFTPKLFVGGINVIFLMILNIVRCISGTFCINSFIHSFIHSFIYLFIYYA